MPVLSLNSVTMNSIYDEKSWGEQCSLDLLVALLS